MRFGQHVQPLSFDLRLPDAAQADALRLLVASRAVVNALLVSLWPSLDAFGGEQRGPAWKQVLALSASPDPHGSRQFRCEAETAGRILRAQASRKQVFGQVLPILSDGFIRPRRRRDPLESTARPLRRPSPPSSRRSERRTRPPSPRC